MEFVCLFFFILFSFFLWLYEDDCDNNAIAVKFYFICIFFSISFVAAFTWSRSSQSICMFYISLIVTISFYVYLYCKAVKIFENIFIKSGEKRYKVVLNTTVFFLSLIFCIWIIVIYGMFLINNDIIPQNNFYESAPKIIGFFDIPGKFNYFLWILKISKEFLVIGIENLFILSPPNDWKLFMMINEWIYKSVILIDLVGSILLNIFVIGKIDQPNTNK